MNNSLAPLSSNPDKVTIFPLTCTPSGYQTESLIASLGSTKVRRKYVHGDVTVLDGRSKNPRHLILRGIP